MAWAEVALKVLARVLATCKNVTPATPAAQQTIENPPSSTQLTISGSASRTMTNEVMLRVTTVRDEAAERMGIGCNSAGTAQ